jgi:hypothetical protein
VTPLRKSPAETMIAFLLFSRHYIKVSATKEVLSYTDFKAIKHQLYAILVSVIYDNWRIFEKRAHDRHTLF